MTQQWSDPTRYGRHGAVCTVDQLATAAGLDVLRTGGNAVDAAVAASAVLAVTTQHMCGMGGDLLAVVQPASGSAPKALLAVGRTGSGSDAAELRAQGHTRMPYRGDIRSVTVPGCVDGWLALHAAHGRLPLARVLAPAIGYAEQGFAVTPLLAAALPHVASVDGGEELAGGTLPLAGDLRRRPLLAKALRAIVSEGRKGWYEGAFGQGLIRIGQGLFTESDLATWQAEWVPAAQLRIGDRLLATTPPPTQGYLVLSGAHVAEALGVLGAAGLDDPHLLIEAARITAHDRPARLADGVPVSELLLPDDLAERVTRVSPDTTAAVQVPTGAGGTIYLCTADSDGMVVSLSQSNAAGFGAYLAVGEVGVFLNNRGLGFSLESGHPAELKPGARPPHTLCPALLIEGEQTTALGTMGGDAQPQILLQLLAALAAGDTPAAALARPRWSPVGPRDDGFDAWEPWPDGSVAPAIAVEAHAPASWDNALTRRGHRVVRAQPGRAFGHAHLLVRRSDGVLLAASDPRAASGDAQAF